MTTIKIPEKIVTTCDCCQVVLDAGNHHDEGMLSLKSLARDMHGQGVGNDGFNMDLCDRCLAKVKKAIDIVKRGETPLCAPAMMTMANAPKILNNSDKAMWVLGWNECAQGGFKG